MLQVTWHLIRYKMHIGIRLLLSTLTCSNLREYLQEERREVPSRYEMNRFAQDVQELRDAVARAQARLRRAAARR